MEVKRQVIQGTRQLGLLVAAIFFGLSSLSATSICRADPPPKIGQKVEVKNLSGDAWEPGEVIEEIIEGKFWKVRLSSGQVRMYDLKRMRPLPKKAEQGELRTWTDMTGNFKIEARLSGIKDGKVVLHKTDGSETRVPLDKLSEADRTYAEKHNPSENPFEIGKVARPVEAFEKPALPKEKQVPPPKPGVDLSSVKQLILMAPSKPSYQPDVNLAKSSLSGEVAVGLPARTNFAEKSTGMVADMASSMVVLSRGAIHDKEGAGVIDFVDLGKKQLVTSISTAKPLKASDVISGESLRVLTYEMPNIHNNQLTQTIQVSDFSGTELKKISSWIPYTFSKDKLLQHRITFAKFVDPEHVLSLNEGGDLILWEVKGGKPLWRVQVEQRKQPVLSAGRKYIAVVQSNRLFVLDTRTGTPAFAVSTASRGTKEVAFSPDGTRLAIGTYSDLTIWDIEEGKEVEKHYVSSHRPGLEWITPDQILLGGSDLYDLPRRIVLWKYSLDSRDGLLRLGGDQFVYTATSNGLGQIRGLFSVSIPHEKALQTAAKLKLKDLLVLEPGAQVELSLRGKFGEDGKEAARQALVTKLEKNGVKIANSSKLVLEATSYRGEEEEVVIQERSRFRYSFRHPRNGRNSQKETITPMRYKLALVEQGQEVWSKSASNRPIYRIQLEKDESVKEALARVTRPTADFFKRVNIPEMITRHPDGGVAFGASMLSYGGIKPTSLPSNKQEDSGKNKPGGKRDHRVNAEVEAAL